MDGRNSHLDYFIIIFVEFNGNLPNDCSVFISFQYSRSNYKGSRKNHYECGTRFVWSIVKHVGA